MDTMDLKQSKMTDYRDFDIGTNGVSVPKWPPQFRFKHS